MPKPTTERLKEYQRAYYRILGSATGHDLASTFGDVELDGVLKAGELTSAFLNKLRDLVSAKVKDGDLSADDWNQAVKTARAHAGGKGKAKKRTEGMPMAANESLTDMIRDVDAALYAQYPGEQGGSRYWSKEVYLDHVIVCDYPTQKMYRVPYARGLDGSIQFGTFEEVEETYAPVEMADLCAKGGKMRLFIEQQFSTPPEWMPLLPKPGEFKHPEYGKISITAERNANFIANFDKGVYQSKLPINAEHVSSDAGAFGWIVGMRQNADDSVDARVNWTDLGTEAIENNRFAYVSPEWVDEYKKNDGTKHSDVVLGAALTVRPFFKEDAMRPLVANESGLHFWSRPPSGDDGNMTFYFTAATPTTPTTEVSMAVDKEARTKRFKEIAKGFKGELATHLKFMDAIAGDSEKPEETEVFKAYVARETELAKPTEEPKDFTEQIKRLDAENTGLKTANETLKTAVDSLTKENRRKRFSDVVKEFSGPAEGHISMLEFIADHEEKGEESERFKKYSEDQRALAEQLKTANIFGEIGSDAPGSTKTAADELNALAKKYQEDHPADKLSFEQAYDVVMGQNTALYNKHKEETRKGVN